MCDDEQARMLEGSEFQTKVASTLKLRETKVVRTRGTDIRFFDLWRSVENVQECGNYANGGGKPIEVDNVWKKQTKTAV